MSWKNNIANRLNDLGLTEWLLKHFHHLSLLDVCTYPLLAGPSRAYASNCCPSSIVRRRPSSVSDI